MANEVRIRATVSGNAKQEIGGLRDGWRRFQKEGSEGVKAGLTAAVAAKGFSILDTAISGSVNFLQDASKAALEEEQSVSRLGAALRANVADWDGNSKAIEDVLASRIRLGFADDEQRDSLARLVSVTKDETKALELQRTAMDLARLRGIDLATAGDLIGKVYGGNIGILARYGIQLEKGTSSTEALAEIQRRAAGQAEAYVEGNGKLLASQVRLGEVTEKIGTVVLPLLADGLGIVAEAAEALVPVIDLINGKLPETEEGFRGLQETVNGFSLNPVTIMTQNAMGQIEEAVEETPRAVRRGLKDMRDASGELAGELPEAMGDAKRDAVQIALETPTDIANALRDGREEWRAAVDLLGDDLENEMSTAAEVAAIQGELAGENLARGLRSADPVVRAQAEATRRILLDRLRELGTVGRDSGRRAGQGLADGLRSTVPAIEGAAKSAAKAVTKFLKVSSPAEAGPLSEMGGPEGMGKKVGQLFDKGLNDAMPDLNLVGSHAGGSTAAATPSGVTGASTVTIIVNVSGVMTPATAQALRDELTPVLAPVFARKS